MNKKVIAVNLAGFLIKEKAFLIPHEHWFKKASEKTGNQKFLNWIGKEDYFQGVDDAMEQIMPDAAEQERRHTARKWYQESVIEYIRNHPEVVNKEAVEMLKRLKSQYEIILITTNTEEYVKEILSAGGIDIFDKFFATKIHEIPSTQHMIEKVIKEYKKPDIYISGTAKNIADTCKENKIRLIHANLEGLQETENVETVKSIEELEKTV